mmetsp:Transcript_78024/g.131059  ORF Transcript_78024/g.131059 Transcript_78024/m.131059 type:complete len:100 (-) Transcript_78024:226-525(-)
MQRGHDTQCVCSRDGASVKGSLLVGVGGAGMALGCPFVSSVPPAVQVEARCVMGADTSHTGAVTKPTEQQRYGKRHGHVQCQCAGAAPGLATNKTLAGT